MATIVEVRRALVNAATERCHDTSTPVRNASWTWVESLSSAVCSIDVAPSDAGRVKPDMTVEALVACEFAEHAARPQVVRDIFNETNPLKVRNNIHEDVMRKIHVSSRAHNVQYFLQDKKLKVLKN